MRFATNVFRWTSLLAFLGLVFAAAPAAGAEPSPPTRKLPAFVKQMVPGEAGLPKRGDHIVPRYGHEQLTAPSTPIHKPREEMLERVRLEYAPHMPSRLESVFATDKNSMARWRGELRFASDRVAVRLRPIDPARVAVVDVAHFDRVHDLIWEAWMVKGDSPKAVRRRNSLMRRAEAAAKDYWTKPPREGSLHEWLLGGGATYIGRVSTSTPSQAPTDHGSEATTAAARSPVRTVPTGP